MISLNATKNATLAYHKALKSIIHKGGGQSENTLKQENALKLGDKDYNEHTFRTALENLLNVLKPAPSPDSQQGEIIITHEPKAKSGQGSIRPDFKVTRKMQGYESLLGFIECKNYGTDLTPLIKGKQIEKYLSVCHNIILTDYNRFILLSFGKVVADLVLFDSLESPQNTHQNTPQNASQNATKSSLNQAKLIEISTRFSHLLGAFFHTSAQIAQKDELVKVLSTQSFYLSSAIFSAQNAGLSPQNLTQDFGRDLGQNAQTFPQDFGQNLAQITAQTTQDSEFKAAFAKSYQSFRNLESTDISPIEFCDILAQNIVYGAFVAHIESEIYEIDKIPPEMFVSLLPKHFITLREFIESSLPARNLPDSITYALSNIIKTIALIDKPSLAKSFAKEIGEVSIYLYEDFLRAYDELRGEQKRKEGGVFYTPEPIVRAITHSINALLKKHFGKSFSDNGVKVLDFATGTGSFLSAVFERILENQSEVFTKATIINKCFRDIYGFEISFVPYIVAHLKLSQILRAKGFSEFSASQKFQVYLTNTLDLDAQRQIHLQVPFDSLKNERDKSLELKHKEDLLVILGNPPYNVKSKNKGKEILSLLDSYKIGLNETKINLDDDYIKFIRFAQWKLLEQKQQSGIMGFITNNSFLYGRTHRKMRESLAKSFDEIYILNLNGDSTEDKNDKNVFDIRVGVCISLFVKYRESTIHCHTDAAFCHTELSQESEVSKNHINCHTNATFCHTEGETRSISKHSFFRNAQNRDISAFSKPQYDKDRDSSLVSLTQNDKVGNPSLRVGEAIHSTPSLRDLPKASRGNPLRSKETYKNTQLAKERDCHESATFNKVVDSRNDNKISPSLAREESESSPSLAEGDKGGGYESLATIHYFSTKDNEILRRADKFALLNDIAHNGLDSIKWQNLTLDSPYFWFVPKDLSNAEYENFWALATNKALGESKAIFEIFNSGVDTNVDKYGFVYGFNANQIYNTIDNFTKMTPQDLRLHYKINDTKSRDWKVEWAKADIVANVDCHESANADAGIASNSRNDELPTPSLRGSEATEAIQNKIHKIAYRPFDLRYTFYTGTQCGFMANPRKKVLSNLLESDNIGMCFTKDSNIADNFLVSPYIIDSHLLAGKAHIAPLYCYDSNLNQQSKVVNFTRAFSEYKTKHKVLKDKSPEQILAFIYGNLYNPNYRAKYIEYLKIGFPRIDFEVSQSHFEKIATLGQNLIDLHLMKNIPSDKDIDFVGQFNASLPIDDTNPNKRYELNTIKLNKSLSIKGITTQMWEYKIGGYEVLKQWLKYRKNYQLSKEELEHFLRICNAIKATISIQNELAKIN